MSEKNNEALYKKLRGLNGKMLDAAGDEVLNGVIKITDSAKQKAPVDTGALRENIRGTYTRGTDTILGEVKTDLPYSKYIEFGTGPIGEASDKIIPEGMDISYRQDGWTYMKEGEGGQEFYYTYGQPARQYMTRAFLENEDEIKERILKSIKDEIKR